jgi:hypothetical protein
LKKLVANGWLRRSPICSQDKYAQKTRLNRRVLLGKLSTACLLLSGGDAVWEFLLSMFYALIE